MDGMKDRCRGDVRGGLTNGAGEVAKKGCG